MSDAISVTEIADLIGDAEVVAIGENNHHIREFGALRDRLLRHLVAERGFTVLGFEGGFPEGHLVDAWLRGGPGDVADIARDGFTFGLGDSAEVHEMLTWLRGRGVRFAGVDVPGSAGSPVPSLAAVREYVSRVDPANVSLVDAAVRACEPYASVSSAVAPGRYQEMSPEARDAATAALTVLKGHVDALAPVYGEVAAHHAEGALRVDLYLRELAAVMAGRAPEPQSSSRDTYMAATVRLLRRLHPGEKIVLMLHNGHLQRVPFSPMPGMTAPSAGTHLAAELGGQVLRARADRRLGDDDRAGARRGRAARLPDVRAGPRGTRGRQRRGGAGRGRAVPGRASGGVGHPARAHDAAGRRGGRLRRRRLPERAGNDFPGRRRIGLPVRLLAVPGRWAFPTGMAGRRRALIVADGEYDNAGLQRLGSPAADADALAGVLSDRASGSGGISRSSVGPESSPGRRRGTTTIMKLLLAAGVAALYLAQHPGASPAQVDEALVRAADGDPLPRA
ncbi:erythromycin esterase family protein [Amycolatopsis sp. NPDC051128]|uniref:erythromycin esterase family protein n=1 Tax=Amycolatopsis sp. NPDC051128 TaxID=3155412 RepID=UPI00343A2FDE